MKEYAQRPRVWKRSSQKELKDKHFSDSRFSDSRIFQILPFLKFFLRFKLRHWFFLFLFFVLVILAGRYFWREMRWRYIVIHHTAADIGSLEFYRKFHEKRWGDLAYHIVINNGSDGTAAGQIEYSKRWKERKHHYSTQKSYLNYFGIAIALVGDFESHPIPIVQEQIFIRLLVNLSREYGIPHQRIIGHREVQNTKCPGKHINMVKIRELVAQKLKKQDDK